MRSNRQSVDGVQQSGPLPLLLQLSWKKKKEVTILKLFTCNADFGMAHFCSAVIRCFGRTTSCCSWLCKPILASHLLVWLITGAFLITYLLFQNISNVFILFYNVKNVILHFMITEPSEGELHEHWRLLTEDTRTTRGIKPLTFR